MKKAPGTYSVDRFITPPECQGQIVTVSYGLDTESQAIVVRTHDGSDRTTEYVAYDYPACDDGSWEPQNGAPRLGRRIGRCRAETD